MNKKISLLELPDELPISEVLTQDELPKSQQPNLDLKKPATQPSGLAFHEKKDKNKKVNAKVRYAEKMKVKYKKPKKRGDKNRAKLDKKRGKK
jgi:ATP-dependent RNA helicase RhlE